MTHDNHATCHPGRAQKRMQIVGNIVGSRRLIGGVAIAKTRTIIETGARERRHRLSHIPPIRDVSAETLHKNDGGRAFAGADNVEATAAAYIDQMLERIPAFVLRLQM